MAINSAQINGTEINGEGSTEFSVFLTGFSNTAIDGVFAFRDVGMVADFYRRAEKDNSRKKDLIDIESHPPGNEP